MKKIIFLIGLLIWNLGSVYGQVCGTPHPVNPTIYPQEDISLRTGGGSPSVRIDVFFHIVRNTDGTNAFTLPNTGLITKELNKYFSSRNIIINNIGSDFINNTYFLTINTYSKEENALFSTQNRSDAINFYIVNGFTSTRLVGMAEDIPSTNLVMRNNEVLRSISAHEFGHCLNLYHTFQGTASKLGCAEAVNGSNCNTCGDLVCDTPADDGQEQDNGYAPDLTNIMSYYLPADHFTNGQGYRMRYAIANESVLQKISSDPYPEISFIPYLCRSSSVTVTLTDLGDATTTWTSSSNVQIVSRNNIKVEIKAIDAGWGWVKATLSSGITLTGSFSIPSPVTIEFPNTSLTHILNDFPGDVTVDYGKIIVRDGDRIPVEIQGSRSHAFRNTKVVDIPEDPPGFESIYDPSSLRQDVPYTSVMVLVMEMLSRVKVT